jgi:hypothetical protein
MNENSPRFKCTGCDRGVLNRDFARCLYCGADLPADVLLPAAEIARRDAARMRLANPKPIEQHSSAGEIADGIEAIADFVEAIADCFSALGD